MQAPGHVAASQPATRGAPTRVLEASYRRAEVIANPVSGRGNGLRAADELCEGLRRSGIAARLFPTTARGAAFSHLRSLPPEVDLVVSVGGDGTLREVLEGLVDPEIPVALLPYGTANGMAQELGLPRDVHHALEVILRGETRPLDAARVNAHLSCLMTGIGLDAVALREVAKRRRRSVNKSTYVRAMAGALLRHRAPRLRVSIDGRDLDGDFGYVLVSSARRYAGLVQLDAAARIDDGRLETYLFPTGTRRELVGAFLRALLRGRCVGGAVDLRRARRVRVSSNGEPVPYHVDGDPGGETPVELEVAPNQYRIVVP